MGYHSILYFFSIISQHFPNNCHFFTVLYAASLSVNTTSPVSKQAKQCFICDKATSKELHDHFYNNFGEIQDKVVEGKQDNPFCRSVRINMHRPYLL